MNYNFFPPLIFQDPNQEPLSREDLGLMCNTNFAYGIPSLFFIKNSFKRSSAVQWPGEQTSKHGLRTTDAQRGNSLHFTVRPKIHSHSQIFRYGRSVFTHLICTLRSEGTLLLNEGIPRALKGKKLRLKNILLLPLIFEEMNYFQCFKSEGRI